MYENLADTLAFLSAIVTSSSNAIISRAVEGHVISWNVAATHLFGYEPDEMVGQPFHRLIPPELQPEANLLFSRVVAGERLAEYETLRLHKAGHSIPVAVTASAIRNVDGRIIGTSKVVRDISVRKHFETRLMESEARFRTLYEKAPIGIGVFDWAGHFESANSVYCGAVGYTENELRGITFSALIHPDDRENDLEQYRRVKAGEASSVELESRCLQKSGQTVWVRKILSLLPSKNGHQPSMLVLAMNVTEQKRAQDNIRLLLHEVSHRSMNMLALVQAVARQTLAATPEDFMHRFGERVRGMAASQDLLIKSAWKGARLHELIRAQLSHFGDLIGTRVELKGPPLLITPSAVPMLGMAFNELGSNAAKYGALSDPRGRITIEWSIEPGDLGSKSLELCWRECGGPPVRQPSAFGFGSAVIGKMIEHAFDGMADLAYRVERLYWRITCRAESVLEEDAQRP